MMKIPTFDLCGVIAVGVFSAVVIADLPNLTWVGREVDVHLSEQEARAGFREGVSWYGLYSGKDKIGFARIEQRREGGGFAVRQNAVLNLEVFGVEQRLETELAASMNHELELVRFTLSLRGGLIDVSAWGALGDGELVVNFDVAGVEHTTSIELKDTPKLNLGANLMVVQAQPRVGTRFEVTLFDPVAMAPRSMIIEYRGREEMTLIDQTVSAHHLRRIVGDTVLDVWVNEVGEVLREELPFAVTAVREAEADATWGLDHGEGESAFLRVAPALLAEIAQGVPQAGVDQ